MKIAIYDQSGQSKTDLNLEAAIFDVTAKPALLAQTVRVQLANGRQSIAHTKIRGEVRGGGRKPWKQKGTGNARAGSTRSPLWIGGGITFGPRNERNFSLRVPQKMRQLAIKSLLSEKAKDKKLIVLDNLELAKISTKSLTEILQKLPIEEGKILVLLDKDNLSFELSAANLPYVKIIRINNLNVLDLLNHDYLLTTVETIKKISEILASEK